MLAAVSLAATDTASVGKAPGEQAIDDGPAHIQASAGAGSWQTRLPRDQAYAIAVALKSYVASATSTAETMKLDVARQAAQLAAEVDSFIADVRAA